MTERVGGTPVVSLSAHLRPYLSGDVSGRFRCLSPRPYISGDVSGHFRCPSPVTSGRTSPATFLAAIVAHHLHLVLLLSPATFSAFTVARHLRLSLSGDILGPYRCPSPPSSPAALSGDISGHIVAHHLRLVLLLSPATFSAHIVARHLRLSLSGYIPGPYRCPSPVTSGRTSPATFLAAIVARHPGRTSPATFLAVSVACHLRPSLSGDILGPYRCPSPPPIPLRRHSRPISLPVISDYPSPATFPAHIVARHLRRTSPATFRSISVARHLRCTSPATFRAISVARHPGRTSPATFRGGITVISIFFAMLRGFLQGSAR